MTPWVRRLIVANVLVFLLQQFVTGLTQALYFVPVLALARPWTVVTYMFLHSTFLHILFNMLSLYWFGPRVEERLGGRAFVALYFLSGIGGAFLSFAIPVAQNIPIVGASGAIMGVAVAYARYWPRNRFYIYGVLPVEAWLLIVLYIALDVGGAWGIGGAGIAHFAHLGGAATAYVFLRVLEWRSPGRQWRRKITAAPTASVFGDGDHLRRWRDIRLDTLHPVNRDEIVRLLEKVQQNGPRSLTPEERATLDRFAGASA
jgi:membrane associated rhomboid family serine protease